MRKKLVLLLSVVMVFGITVGVTLAWLTDTTSEVKNTFTVGDIAITLEETWNADGDDIDTEYDHWEAQLVPGKSYVKDPVVTVDGELTNVDCYLFVEFDETNNPSQYLTYTSLLNTTNGWTLVEDETNVWYRVVKTGDTTKSWDLLADNTVTVKNELTKETLRAMKNDGTTPELVYKAYAIQTEGFNTAELAWAEVSKSN